MKHPCSFFSTIVVASMLVVLTPSCATNPVTGEHQLMLLSESDEIRLGKGTDQEIGRIYGLYDDGALESYIDALGREIARHSHRPGLPYQFQVLDSPVVNAFAVPGGFVYVTRGILAYLNSEAELVGVLGHELGHIAARHSAAQYSRAQLAQLGLGIGSVFSETFRGFAGLAQFGVGMMFLKFSRDNEREADDLGVEYATKAGFDANEMARFFFTLQRLQPASDAKGLPSWLSTHPDPPDRIGAIQERARQWAAQTGSTALQINRDGYLNRLDGLLFGEDPRQGYVTQDVFYHPLLRFQFPVPKDWKLNNTPAQVQIVHPKGEGAILFSGARSQSARSAAAAFVQETQAQVLQSEAVSVSGLPAHRVVGDLNTQQGTIRAVSYFIELDGYIYVFHGITAPSRFGTYWPVFKPVMEGFRALTDPARIHVKPSRIRVLRAPRGGPFRQVLADLKVSQDQLDKTAVLNGKDLNDPVSPGLMIKTIEPGDV